MVENIDPDAVAAVRVDSPIAEILRNGFDSSDINYVRTPLSQPHILWHAHIANAPTSSHARPLPMLIDTGTPTVLICDSVVASHSL